MSPEGTDLAFDQANVNQRTLRKQVSVLYFFRCDPFRRISPALGVNQIYEAQIAFLYRPNRGPRRRLPMQIPQRKLRV